MTELVDHPVVLVDSATASTLAQVLPVLLLTLAVELRRTERHRGVSRVRIGVFFFIFGLIETTLVLSIDGAFYPFQWFDICSALIIFGLLAILFRLALSDAPEGGRDQRTGGPVDSDRDG